VDDNFKERLSCFFRIQATKQDFFVQRRLSDRPVLSVWSEFPMFRKCWLPPSSGTEVVGDPNASNFATYACQSFLVSRHYCSLRLYFSLIPYHLRVSRHGTSTLKRGRVCPFDKKRSRC